MTVGDYGYPKDERALVGRYSARGWRFTRLGSVHMSPSAVSCHSASSCVAVGEDARGQAAALVLSSAPLRGLG